MSGRGRPRLALSMGEPAGIGGEIALKAWRAMRDEPDSVFFLLDDPDRIAAIADDLALAVPVRPIERPAEADAAFADALPVLPLTRSVRATPGRPDPATAAAVLEAIERAVALCRDGEASAMVTNPIQKSALYAAGFRHPGHTEFLAACCGVARSWMMLVSPELKSVPVTIHLPLREAIATLDSEAIVAAGMAAADSLRRHFGIAAPRLAVSGLNPHAGEDGALGHEDGAIVAPAVRQLRDAGIAATGPLPADTMFHAKARAGYDAALCMYHDQALIPVKALAFDDGVNVTLGLPIIRTSPDHGTALDIAGRGEASEASLLSALRLAATMARQGA